MPVVVLVLLGALLGGWLRGGSLGRLATLSLPGWPLVVGALAVQLVGGLVAGADGRPAYPVALVLSAVLVTAFVVRNRSVRGMRLVALGFVLNAVVVVANGAMPVSSWAAARAGISADAAIRGGRHEVAGPGTRLRPLGDVIPAPMPIARLSSVLSPGDVVLAAGLGVLVLAAMVPPPGRRRQSRS
ncbi:MAG TPA: DUF5317 family protein [Mycobacteriales bacterium]|nr:DUF5317 family protein [Mycobacteriales bacterium]